VNRAWKQARRMMAANKLPVATVSAMSAAYDRGFSDGALGERSAVVALLHAGKVQAIEKNLAGMVSFFGRLEETIDKGDHIP